MGNGYHLLHRVASAHYSSMLAPLLLLVGCASSDLTESSELSDAALTSAVASADLKGGKGPRQRSELTALAITPGSVSLESGATQRFVATAKLKDGSTTSTRVKWTASGGTIDGNGLYTSGGAGVHRVIATTVYSNLADTAVVTVAENDEATLVSLAISPGSATLATGGTQRFSVSGRLSDGTNISPKVTWTVAGGTITSDGLYTAGSNAGTHRAVATHESSLADTATITITAPEPEPEPEPTPSLAGCPTSGYRRPVNVASWTALTSAMSNAQPGDQIQMVPGTYSGSLTISRRGTATDSITLCGPATAIISGPISMTDAQYWRLQGFQVKNGWIGIYAQNSSHNRISGLEVSNVKQEGIMLWNGSSHNVLTGNYVHHTGTVYPKYGEGFYIGQGRSDATTAEKIADFNRIENNRLGPYVRGESIDLKRGTQGNRVLNNEVDATGFTLIWLNGKTAGVINGDGEDQLIQGNTVRNALWTPPPGETTPNWGVFRSYQSSVLFTQNTIIGPTTARRAFDKDNASATVVRCDNLKPSTLPWGTTCTN